MVPADQSGCLFTLIVRYGHSGTGSGFVAGAIGGGVGDGVNASCLVFAFAFGAEHVKLGVIVKLGVTPETWCQVSPETWCQVLHCNIT